ncbi:MAG: hypothetical protein EBY17_28910, partial [Acidobacteriia bacterium]|nr:hypothetical protein [Terriglobia bacterium]
NRYDEMEYAIRYLIGQWDEKRWRIQIEHHDRFQQTNQEYVDVILTWLVVMTDLFQSQLLTVAPAVLTLEHGRHCIQQMYQISQYTNQVLTEMNTLYRRVTPLIHLPPSV